MSAPGAHSRKYGTLTFPFVKHPTSGADTEYMTEMSIKLNPTFVKDNVF